MFVCTFCVRIPFVSVYEMKLYMDAGQETNTRTNHPITKRQICCIHTGVFTFACVCMNVLSPVLVEVELLICKREVVRFRPNVVIVRSRAHDFLDEHGPHLLIVLGMEAPASLSFRVDARDEVIKPQRLNILRKKCPRKQKMPAAAAKGARSKHQKIRWRTVRITAELVDLLQKALLESDV